MRSSDRHLVPPAPSEPAAPPLHALGEGLFDALFSGQIRSLYDRSLGELRGQSNCGLRIKLKLDPSVPKAGQLQALPWELMRRAETQEYLNLNRFSPVVRYLDVPVPFHALPLPAPLRVLVVISSPIDLEPLDVATEQKQLENLRSGGSIDVDILENAQPETLRRALIEKEIHVVHFIGHGGFNPGSGEGVLYFVGSDQRSRPISGNALASKLRDVPTLRLAVLNACESGRADRSDGNPFAGVANALVLGGMPAVVAMQVPISDAAAIAFSEAFYRHLAAGDPVDAALTEGRQAIHSAAPDGAEWSTPVLFLRIPDSTIFEPLRAASDRPLIAGEPVPSGGAKQRSPSRYITGLIVILLTMLSIASWSWLESWRIDWGREVGTLTTPPFEEKEPTTTSPPSEEKKPVAKPEDEPSSKGGAVAVVGVDPPPPPISEPVKKEPLYPLSTLVRGKVGILVLDKSTQKADSEAAWAIESALSDEITSFAPMAPSQVTSEAIENLLQNDFTTFPSDGRTPWGAEYLLVVRSQRKQLSDRPNLESLSLSLSAQLIVTADRSVAKRTSSTHTGRGASTDQALTQAAGRCLREMITFMKELG